MPLLARLGLGDSRPRILGAYYGTRGGARWGRYKPRYGPIWWW